MRHLLAALAVLALVCPASHAEPVPVDMAPVIHNDLLVASAPASLPVGSAPASPSVIRVAADWIEANPGWCKLVALLLLILLGNGLARYPRAAGVLRYVHLGIDLLSPVVRADSPGTFKPPLVSYDAARGFVLSLSQPPASPAAPANPLAVVGGAGLALLFACGFLSACAASPYDKARQSLTGIEAAVSSTARLLDAYDRPHQEDVRSSAAATCQQGDVACIDVAEKAALAHYRNNRNVAVKALVSLGAAASLAEAGVTVAESAKSKGFDPLAAVAQLGPALQEAVEALKAIGIQSAALAAIVGGL